MDRKQQLLNLPRTLEDSLTRKRPEYEQLIRRTRWGAGPLYVLASGDSLPNAVAAQYAFEGLLGWPVLVRHPAVFLEYAMPLLRPRAVLMVLAGGRQSGAIGQVVRAAATQHLPVVTLPSACEETRADSTGDPPLRQTTEESAIQSPVLEQAVICYLAVLAARMLKAPSRHIESWQEELEGLPRRADWVLTQTGAAVRSLAAEMTGHKDFAVAGAGFYHPTALHAERVLSRQPGVRATAVSALESLEPRAKTPMCIVVSGSQCRARKGVDTLLAQMRKTGTRVLAITDSSDRTVRDAADMALLLPPLSEIAGSVLAHFLVRWLGCELERAGREAPRRPTQE